MSEEVQIIYEIGDMVDIDLIGDKTMKDVQYLGLDNLGLLVFQKHRHSSKRIYSVPKSSIILMELKLK